MFSQLWLGGVNLAGVATPFPDERATDPDPMPAWRRIAMVTGLTRGVQAQHIPGLAESHDLIHRAARYLLLGPLIYRLLAIWVPLATIAGQYSMADISPVIGIAIVLAGANIALLALLLSRPTLHRSHLSALLIVDAVLGFAGNVVASAAIPGPLTESYHDVFWPYLVGTVALWTAAWGLRGGLIPVALSVPVQAAMAVLNAAEDAGSELAAAISRSLWLAVAIVVTTVVLGLIGIGVRLTLTVGVRCGQEAEHARNLRMMHDTVLQALESMALTGPADRIDPGLALSELRAVARGQAALLRRSLGQLAPSAVSDDLLVQLQGVAAEASEQGLRTELVCAGLLDQTLAPTSAAAMREAVAEALRNTLKHSGVTAAVVRVSTTGGGVEATIRDHGRGFSATEESFGFGLTQSVVARVEEVGGVVDVESWPGKGTRVRMWVPA